MTDQDHAKIVREALVTQADREAAAEWAFIECRHCSEYEGNFSEDLAQAFARHRLAAEAAAFEKAAGVAEKIAADWRAKVSGYRQAGNDGPYLGEPTGDDIATAIRRLAGEKHD